MMGGKKGKGRILRGKNISAAKKHISKEANQFKKLQVLRLLRLFYFVLKAAITTFPM